ncbi:MAG: dksA [Burkholderiales bacterium]|nr:dksA [Burkholderiales bacterium]
MKFIGVGMSKKKTFDVSKLTDQDILGMPETEYMNQTQLEYFKNRLLEAEQEILENAKKTTQAFQEQDTNYIADPSDRATLEEEYALELRTRDRERKLLQKIRKALTLIESGSYGFCEDSGEPIGLKRLLARPTATLTIEAQERREEMQKHFAEE